jgi:hypothetical protein
MSPFLPGGRHKSACSRRGKQPGRMAALREVERCSVGRKARIEGKVEEAVLPVAAPAQ